MIERGIADYMRLDPWAAFVEIVNDAYQLILDHRWTQLVSVVGIGPQAHVTIACPRATSERQLAPAFTQQTYRLQRLELSEFFEVDTAWSVSVPSFPTTTAEVLKQLALQTGVVFGLNDFEHEYITEPMTQAWTLKASPYSLRWFGSMEIFVSEGGDAPSVTTEWDLEGALARYVWPDLQETPYPAPDYVGVIPRIYGHFESPYVDVIGQDAEGIYITEELAVVRAGAPIQMANGYYCSVMSWLDVQAGTGVYFHPTTETHYLNRRLDAVTTAFNQWYTQSRIAQVQLLNAANQVVSNLRPIQAGVVGVTGWEGVYNFGFEAWSPDQPQAITRLRVRSYNPL